MGGVEIQEKGENSGREVSFTERAVVLQGVFNLIVEECDFHNMCLNEVSNTHSFYNDK